MNTTISSLSFEEQGAILFTSAIFCIGSVVAFGLFLLQLVGKTRGMSEMDCCCFNLCRLIYKKCCKCSDLNNELKKHLKEDDDDL